MNTNETLAPADARHDEAPHTRAARPSNGQAARAPAVITKRAAPPADVVADVRASTSAVNKLTRSISKSDALRRIDSLKRRATSTLHESVNERDAAAKRGRVDVLTTHKIDRITNDQAALDANERAELRRLQRVTARPSLNVRGGSERSGRSNVQTLHRAAQMHYLRTGETTYHGHSLATLQQQAAPQARTMFGGSGTDGGFLIAPETDTGPIEKLLKEYVPMRSHATVKTINAYTYKKPIRTNTGGAKWGNELASGGKTDAPKYSLLDFPAHNLYAEPAVSSDLLEDSAYNVEQEIADGSIEDFSVAEGAAFISGDGVEKPYGILGYSAGTYVANASWAWGKVGYITTGAAGAFPASSGSVASADPIVALEYQLKAMYRQNAKFMMNRLTIGKCRQLKDAQGRFVWSDGSVINGQPATLSGREVIEAEDMPDVAADSFAIALADWARFYYVVDRTGLIVLRDPYSAYPAIAFKTRKRVGGGIANFEAGKLLKFAA